MLVAQKIRNDSDAKLARNQIKALESHTVQNQHDLDFIAKTKVELERYELSNRFFVDPNHRVMRELIQKQGSLSDRLFSAKLIAIGPTTWHRLKKGEYMGDNVKAWTNVQNSLVLIKEQEALNAIRPNELVPMTHQETIIQAIRSAQSEERDRFIAFLAKTGGGKDYLAKAICEAFPQSCLLLDASPTWRSSYYAPIAAIADRLGIIGIPCRSAAAEQAVFQHLKSHKRIIIINEANYFSADTLNFLKSTMNETKCVVVVLALPLLWENLEKKAWKEADQVVNRTYLKLTYETISVEDLRRAIASEVPRWNTLGSDSRAAETLLLNAAHSFGLWNTIFPVLTQLSDREVLTLEDVKQELKIRDALRRN